MSSVLPFIHPVVSEFQKAVAEHWQGHQAVVARRPDGWVVIGKDCESPAYSLSDLKRFTRAIAFEGVRSA